MHTSPLQQDPAVVPLTAPPVALAIPRQQATTPVLIERQRERQRQRQREQRRRTSQALRALRVEIEDVWWVIQGMERSLLTLGPEDGIEREALLAVKQRMERVLGVY